MWSFFHTGMVWCGEILLWAIGLPKIIFKYNWAFPPETIKVEASCENIEYDQTFEKSKLEELYLTGNTTQ